MKFLLLLAALLPLAASAETDLDQKLSCKVIESSRSDLPIGGPAVPVTLRALRDEGYLGIGAGLIDFYGKVSETTAQGGLTVLARQSGELIGSVVALPRGDKVVELRVLIAHTLTGRDKATGKTAFLLVNLPELYDVAPELDKLSCDVL